MGQADGLVWYFQQAPPHMTGAIFVATDLERVATFKDAFWSSDDAPRLRGSGTRKWAMLSGEGRSGANGDPYEAPIIGHANKLHVDSGCTGDSRHCGGVGSSKAQRRQLTANRLLF